MEKQKPRITPLSRRTFLKLTGLGAGVMTAVSTSTFLTGCNDALTPDGSPSVLPESASQKITAKSIPVRNPAFQLASNISSSDSDSVEYIVYCIMDNNQSQAFELNAAGLDIWHACSKLDDVEQGKTQSVEQISSRLRQDHSIDLVTFKQFLEKMLEANLIFFHGSETINYFPYQGSI